VTNFSIFQQASYKGAPHLSSRGKESWPRGTGFQCKNKLGQLNPCKLRPSVQRSLLQFKNQSPEGFEMAFNNLPNIRIKYCFC